MPSIEEGLVCTGCEQEKLVTEFYKSAARTTGYASRCKVCVAAYQKKHHKEYDARKPRREYHPDYVHVYKCYLKTKYGITPEQYAEMLFLQGGVCKLCKQEDKSGKRLAVDHNHDTGEVRGLLCSKCNTGLGLFNEDPEMLALAIQYLKGGE